MIAGPAWTQEGRSFSAVVQTAKLLITKDERARRIAANIAKLPELLRPHPDSGTTEE